MHSRVLDVNDGKPSGACDRIVAQQLAGTAAKTLPRVSGVLALAIGIFELRAKRPCVAILSCI
jgi:hypothetical protein